LLDNAPDSFDDLRLGRIADEANHQRKAGNPFSYLAVRGCLLDRQLDDLVALLDTLPLEVVPIELAEQDAEPIWKHYQLRRCLELFDDSANSLREHPDSVQSIIAHHRSALDRIDGTDQFPPFQAYYDTAQKCYWIENARNSWIEVNETGLKRHLRACGVSPNCPDRKIVSPLDLKLIHLQKHHDVAYAGPLSGHPKGIHEICGNRILVTSSPRLIEPKEGQFPLIERVLNNLFEDQLPYMFGWLKVSLAQLRSQQHRPGQMLAMAGEGGSGKSLCQEFITVLLGGRVAKPYRYMSAETPFNGDLFGAEHLMIEDEIASTDMRTRRNFGARIKEFTVGLTQSCHSKNRPAITLTPFWRLTISLNDEPENLLILPPLDDSLVDKIILLKADKKALPKPTGTNAQRKAVWDELMNQLPAFVWYLEHWEIPLELKSERFGIRHFQHPDLVKTIETFAPEMRLIALIDAELFKGPVTSAWSGTAEQLERALMNSPSAYEARRLLDWNNAAGTYLGRLAKKYPERVEAERDGNKRTWNITTARNEPRFA